MERVSCVFSSILNSQLFIPPPLPWHHRSTPSMAPGRSCADRPWIGVPSASCSSFCRCRAAMELHAVMALEHSPSVPPRGDSFRFGHVQCAAVSVAAELAIDVCRIGNIDSAAAAYFAWCSEDEVNVSSRFNYINNHSFKSIEESRNVAMQISSFLELTLRADGSCSASSSVSS